MKGSMKEIILKAEEAARALSLLSTDDKNKALFAMSEALTREAESIKKANKIDIENAKKTDKNAAFIDRLELTDKRIEGMVSMLKTVVSLDDPVGKLIENTTRPNGLSIDKVRVPIGVIGIIFESRPNVTADCVSLCLKSGNAAILRGGSDAINSNTAIYKVLKKGAEKAGLIDGAFILVEDTNRSLVDEMLQAVGGIDLIIPRGGESLIRRVVEKSRIPVIKHYNGICHVYVDSNASLTMAEEICFNAKVQRPGVCNAMETMIVHEQIAGEFLPKMAERLIEAGVKLKGCIKTKEILKDVEIAKDEDYSTEYLDLILNIKVVASLDEAVEHISRFGSQHSDAIVTEDKRLQEEFSRKVDSSAIFINSSTRFNDGGEFGKGAEIGISTDKLHARGPVGLEELTTYKYVVRGTGQVRE